MTMFKTTGRGYEVTIKCRKCGEDMTLSVIELSRLHHPPTCPVCLTCAEPSPEPTHE